MNELKQLYIKAENDDLFFETQNYLLDQNNPIVKAFADHYFSLSPEEVLKIQETMTEKHCYHEMNFQVKDESGMYNKVVATPFHGFAPIKKSLVDELVNSTQPVLKATRTLLQNLLSSDKLTTESLGVSNLPKEIGEELIEIIENNIYFEPNFRNRNLKDYPFLSVVGFDSAVSNLSKSENTFFEFNAGTPCGIEDQFQLFHHFKNEFPELAEKITPYIPQDQSHKFLRDTIDQCAKAWTGNEDGISVILGPGTYNPAHPEIASLAIRSGMPMIKIQDLYIDKNGDVRLKTVNEKHPKVTGIYNRKEESFLLYSEKYKIPLRSPFTKQNKELSKQYGVELKDGILYSYTYDDNFNINGVEIDEDSKQAKYQVLFEQISEDPTTGVKGDIIKAIWDKKLFISNLGGRIFDDKRAFRIIYEYILKNNEKAAHPPTSVSVNELEHKIEEAVIKAPDLSGGAGVLIGAQLTENEKIDILSKVKERPDYYELQQFNKLAVVNSYSKERNKFIPLPIDWRLIVTFNSKDEVSLSSHSCLVRTAPYGSIKTNTSSGGGYALGLIYDEKKAHNSNWEKPSFSPVLTETRKNDLELFKNNMTNFLENPQVQDIENLTYQLRDIMDLIGLDNIVFINKLRDFQQNKIDIEQLKTFYSDFNKGIL